MPNTWKKTAKFFMYSPSKKGRNKGKALIVTNYDYKGTDKITLRDLILFLKEKNVDPASIPLDRRFSQEAVVF